MRTTAPTDAGQDPPGRRPRRTRALRAILAAVAVVALGLAADAALLAGRVDHVEVQLHPGPGTTWVLVGLDSRAELPAGATVADFGSPADVPGSRADVVLVVHRTGDRTVAVSVPRDLVVVTEQEAGRLALTWLDGPQATVDGLCALGIPTDHLVTVDLAGFAAVVDAAGGIDVDVPAPVRDPAAGLELAEAGRQHLDGATALALVRSRHPEEQVDGAWVPAVVDPDGRPAAAGAVLDALAGTVRGSLWRPWRAQRTAWAASGAVTTDHGTGIGDLVGLARTDPGPVAVLPAGAPVGDTLFRFPTESTRTFLAEAGLSCSD